MIYRLDVRDYNADHTVEIEADTIDEAREQIDEACQDWVDAGEWGDNGAVVETWWTLLDEDGEEVDEGSHTVEIEPNHEALIRAAGGDPDCEHDWTGDGHGGCDENPGVTSLGGTALIIADHCVRCGLIRHQLITGSQRNPGEHDTVEYSQGHTDD